MAVSCGVPVLPLEHEVGKKSSTTKTMAVRRDAPVLPAMLASLLEHSPVNREWPGRDLPLLLGGTEARAAQRLSTFVIESSFRLMRHRPVLSAILAVYAQPPQLAMESLALPAPQAWSRKPS